MQLKDGVKSIGWIIVCLVMLAAGMAWLVFAASPSPGKFGGGFLLAIGALNLLFYKTSGRRFFAKTQSSSPAIARFWAHSGESGIQILFLGIGIILAAAGCILLFIRSE
jgi:hypothetical protein